MDIDLKQDIKQAIQLQQAGKLEEAIQLYKKILTDSPQHQIATISLGITLFQAKEYQSALDVLQKAATSFPESADAHYNLAYALLQLQRVKESVPHFQKTVHLNPRFFQAFIHLGNIYVNTGALEQGNQQFMAAYRIDPNNLELLNNWTKACIELKNYEQANKILEKALKLYPNRAELYGNLATIHQELGEMHQAEMNLKKSITLSDKDWRFYNALAVMYHKWNKYSNAIDYFKKALELDPNNSIVHSNIIYSQNYFSEYDNAYQLKSHQEWQERHAPLSLKIQEPYLNTPTLPLKVGLLSSDFFNHPVAVFLIAWLKHINREKIQFYAYTEIQGNDEYTQLIKKECETWYETNSVSDKEVAEKIHSDGIDILIDLTGHTKKNRLLVMAYQPAPIQISYLGYINTTGLPQINYRLVDKYVNPPESQQFYTEKLLYLPNFYICYSPPNYDLKVEPTPALKNKHLTFGSFNNPSKYNSEVFQLWAEVLSLYPDAKLVLKARHFGSKEGIETVSKMLLDENIDLNQIIFEGTSFYKEYFEAYHKVDIVLDSFPHNGGTTTHDALYMGVPIVTLEGNNYVSRDGGFYLNQLRTS